MAKKSKVVTKEFEVEVTLVTPIVQKIYVDAIDEDQAKALAIKQIREDDNLYQFVPEHEVTELDDEEFIMIAQELDENGKPIGDAELDLDSSENSVEDPAEKYQSQGECPKVD